jgi:hypothetical protein
MNARNLVTFEQALQLAVTKAKSAPQSVGEITLVRDLRGRIRLLLKGDRTDYPAEVQSALDRLAEELSKALGNYAYLPDRTLLFAGDLMQGKEVVESPDRILVVAEGPVKVYLLDRQITGQDWMRDTLPRTTKNPRVTFFGIKGGVGRSTALVIWAWHLARQGKQVIVFDLDLESPGVSSTLLPPEYLPDFGIVDWFVEAGVGQEDAVEAEMVALSPLSTGQPGDIRVVPAFGRKTGDYLPKLARCYIDMPEGDTNSWSRRLERLVSRFETLWEPHVAFLESRAGLLACLLRRLGRGLERLVCQLLRLLLDAVEEALRRTIALEGRQRIDDLLRGGLQRDDRLAALLLDIERGEADRDALLASPEEAADAHQNTNDLVPVVDEQVLDVADDLAVRVPHLGEEHGITGEIDVRWLLLDEDALRVLYRRFARLLAMTGTLPMIAPRATRLTMVFFIGSLFLGWA